MTGLLKTAGLAGLLAAALAAASPARSAGLPESGVREGQGMTTELGGGARAITYWVSAPDGWHVVTTVDAATGTKDEADAHLVVRFAAVLLPGQSQLISVPFAAGEPQQVLRIRRIGDRIEVTKVPGPSA
jgi:hypothetical protein